MVSARLLQDPIGIGSNVGGLAEAVHQAFSWNPLTLDSVVLPHNYSTACDRRGESANSSQQLQVEKTWWRTWLVVKIQLLILVLRSDMVDDRGLVRGLTQQKWSDLLWWFNFDSLTMIQKEPWQSVFSEKRQVKHDNWTFLRNLPRSRPYVRRPGVIWPRNGGPKSLGEWLLQSAWCNFWNPCKEDLAPWNLNWCWTLLFVLCFHRNDRSRNSNNDRQNPRRGGLGFSAPNQNGSWHQQ